MSRRASQGFFTRAEAFLREYTAGISSGDVKSLFERDAANAFAVLIRQHARGPEPQDGFERFFFRARLVFLGLSYRLSPPRRLLFAGAMVALVLGLFFKVKMRLGEGTTVISVNLSGTWFLLSTAALLLLLILELVDRIRVRDELDLARQLQSDLLPKDLPLLPGYRFAHCYKTANEVGGDFYDVTQLHDGRVALLVADASGHGMAAGLVMAIANATWKTALDLDPHPERVLALLNRALCRTGGPRTYLTAFYGLLDPETGHLLYLSAGHPFPLLRRTDGTLYELGQGGLPLGMRSDLAFTAEETTLEPGDLLVLYTDGLVEALNPTETRAFGYDRLAELVATGGSPEQVYDRILVYFDEHTERAPLRDDLTLMVVARVGAVPGARSQDAKLEP